MSDIVVIPASAQRVSGNPAKVSRWSVPLDSRSALRLAGMTEAALGKRQ